jgi:hypothetical protein
MDQLQLRSIALAPYSAISCITSGRYLLQPFSGKPSLSASIERGLAVPNIVIVHHGSKRYWNTPMRICNVSADALEWSVSLVL